MFLCWQENKFLLNQKNEAGGIDGGAGMNIVLISVQPDIDVVGIKYLHYTLLNKGHNSFLFFVIRGYRGSLEKMIEEINPSYIGISVMSQDFHKAAELTKRFKDNFSIPIIWGGVHPSMSPEMCLDYADYICAGESEQSILDIAEGKDIKTINNIYYRINGKTIKNPLYGFIDDLDSIPIYEHIPRNAYIVMDRVIPLDKKTFKKYGRYFGTIYNILTSRGCPYSCAFCCNNFYSKMYGSNKIRRRSVDNIIFELKEAVKQDMVKTIVFHDDCFLLADSDYIRGFSELYKKYIDKPFQILTYPVHVTDEKIKNLKEAGLMWVSMGFQSGSDEVCRKIYKRDSTKKDFFKAVEILNKHKVPLNYDVIIDNPLETKEQQYETIKAITQIRKPTFPRFFSLTPYHGTEIYERMKLECPDEIDDPTTKSYYVNHKSLINTLTNMACFLPQNYILKLISYPENSIKFKVLYAIGKMLLFIFSPINYFNLFCSLQNGSSAMIIVPGRWLIWGILNRGNMSPYRSRIRKEKDRHGQVVLRK